MDQKLRNKTQTFSFQVVCNFVKKPLKIYDSQMAILRPFLFVFLFPTALEYFTKLRFRRSFSGAYCSGVFSTGATGAIAPVILRKRLIAPAVSTRNGKILLKLSTLNIKILNTPLNLLCLNVDLIKRYNMILVKM